MIPLCLRNRVRVDLGNHQRHVRVHPPIAALVDHHAAAANGVGNEVAGDVVGRAADDEVHAVEDRSLQLLDRDLSSGEGDLPAGRSARRHELHRAKGELAGFEQFTNDGSHGAGGANDRDTIEHGKSPICGGEARHYRTLGPESQPQIGRTSRRTNRKSPRSGGSRRRGLVFYAFLVVSVFRLRAGNRARLG